MTEIINAPEKVANAIKKTMELLTMELQLRPAQILGTLIGVVSVMEPLYEGPVRTALIGALQSEALMKMRIFEENEIK